MKLNKPHPVVEIIIPVETTVEVGDPQQETEMKIQMETTVVLEVPIGPTIIITGIIEEMYLIVMSVLGGVIRVILEPYSD